MIRHPIRSRSDRRKLPTSARPIQWRLTVPICTHVGRRFSMGHATAPAASLRAASEGGFWGRLFRGRPPFSPLPSHARQGLPAGRAPPRKHHAVSARGPLCHHPRARCASIAADARAPGRALGCSSPAVAASVQRDRDEFTDVTSPSTVLDPPGTGRLVADGVTLRVSGWVHSPQPPRTAPNTPDAPQRCPLRSATASRCGGTARDRYRGGFAGP